MSKQSDGGLQADDWFQLIREEFPSTQFYEWNEFAKERNKIWIDTLLLDIV